MLVEFLWELGKFVWDIWWEILSVVCGKINLKFKFGILTTSKRLFFQIVMFKN